VQDAREVVKTGQVVKVRVLEVDVARKRIGLTMKLDAAPSRKDAPRENRFEPRRDNRGGSYSARPTAAAPTAMSSAFDKLKSLQK
jgi:protein Tex